MQYEDQMVNKIHELDGMAGLTADVPELQSLPGKGGPAKTLRPNLDFAGMWQISGRCLCFSLRLGRSWMMTEVLRNGFVLCSYLRGEVQASGSVGCQRKDEVGKVQTLTIPFRYLAYICVFPDTNWPLVERFLVAQHYFADAVSSSLPADAPCGASGAHSPATGRRLAEYRR